MFLRIESNHTNADTRRGEILLGFYVRAGHWIDAIEVLTSLGRKSGVFGNATGGSGYVILLDSWVTIFLTNLLRYNLIPPLGYKVAGLSGSCGDWIDGFSLIIMH